MRPTVVLSLHPAWLDHLLPDRTRARIHTVADVLPAIVQDWSEPGLSEADLEQVDVLVTGWGAPSLDEAALARLPRLRAVLHAAGSVKLLVAPAVWERGIRVSSAVQANAIPVAEYTVAVIVLANKDFFGMAHRLQQQRRSADHAEAARTIGNLDRTVGIIGASRIGRLVLERLGSLDLDLLVSDPYLSPEQARTLGADLVDLDDLLTRSDVVSIHAPALPETAGLLDARRLALVRDGASIINTARGSLIDGHALEQEAVSGRLTFILDVTEPDPLPPDSPLYGRPNVILTPHIAGSLGTECRRLGEVVAEELERFSLGEPLAFGIDPASLATSA